MANPLDAAQLLVRRGKGWSNIFALVFGFFVRI